jgi:hypothetical protein
MPKSPALNYVDLIYPVKGVDTSRGFNTQPKATTPVGTNVRGIEWKTYRQRGGCRPGLSKYVATKPNGTNLIQELAYIPTTHSATTSAYGRSIKLLAVSGGVAKTTTGSTWAALSGTAGALNATGIIRSALNSGILFFVDGTNYVYYNTITDQQYVWGALAGSMPVDGSGNKCRLICNWRNRIVMSGLPEDAGNWFMSAVGNATDWDYAPATTIPTQAVAGNNAPSGLVPDIVTCMIPYSDDVLIFGADHSIHMMQGDPMAGGRIDLVSDSIGMAWGNPWCKDGNGTVYFMSNRTGVFAFTPNGKPLRMSQQIDSELRQINMATNSVRMCWDEITQGFHVFITPIASSAAATHYFWEKAGGAWWKDTFTTADMNPLCCVAYDGPDPDDRVTLIGSWDGYVRQVDGAATTDDGTNIASELWLGPILTKDFDDVMFKDVQAILGEQSGNVTWSAYVGTTPEAALASTAVATGTWSAGRNRSDPVRRVGHAVYVKITATVPWQFEALRACVQSSGKVRRRNSY